jgi:hypothetical protein
MTASAKGAGSNPRSASVEVASPWSGVLDLRDAEVIQIAESYRKKK